MTARTTVCPRVVGASENGREMVLCGRPLPCRHHERLSVDELARAICAVERRDLPHHDRYLGARPCVECLGLARRVVDELRPVRVQ